MIDAFIEVLKTFPIGLVYVGMGILLLAFARLVQDFVTPYKIQEQLRTHDNVALALSIAGYYLGIIIVFVGAVYQPFTSSVDSNLGFTTEYWEDVIEVLVTTVIGIIILNVARIIVDKLVLYKFSTEKEIVEDHNAGTGAVEAAVYVSVGIVIAGSVAGVGGGPETSFAFLGLGLLTLILYTLFYEFTTSYDVHDEIERDNVAVGVALAGNLIAISIVVFKAVFGDFTTWEEGIAGFLTFAVIGTALLFVVRTLVDLILFPKVSMAQELAVDRNLGLALIETSVLVSASLILYFAI
ncbi:MAG: DUF350 domain-containing protein [SAR202 cluster bacterium]|jgi:uncharacterized membrane protein YjfL (UPF0719 family)|nr:DUF350 domain-containing protein [SAR202 cluster bacterium]|tara:strand:+ start:1764 stop:2651 length:888 start_codon:yes stop_codon:yes gene_type:complete